MALPLGARPDLRITPDVGHPCGPRVHHAYSKPRTYGTARSACTVFSAVRNRRAKPTRPLGAARAYLRRFSLVARAESHARHRFSHTRALLSFVGIYVPASRHSMHEQQVLNSTLAPPAARDSYRAAHDRAPATLAQRGTGGHVCARRTCRTRGLESYAKCSARPHGTSHSEHVQYPVAHVFESVRWSIVTS